MKIHRYYEQQYSWNKYSNIMPICKRGFGRNSYSLKVNCDHQTAIKTANAFFDLIAASTNKDVCGTCSEIVGRGEGD